MVDGVKEEEEVEDEEWLTGRQRLACVNSFLVGVLAWDYSRPHGRGSHVK